MAITAVLDGDMVAYQSAAATELRTIDVTMRGTDKRMSFKTRTEWKAHAAANSLVLDDYDVVDVQEPEPFWNTKHLIERTVGSWASKCEADRVEVYIGGDNNFREFLPLPKRYKSNRDDMLRPIFLKDAKAAIVNMYGHPVDSVVNGYESDDKLAMRAWDGVVKKERIIQVTRDKDAMGCQGLHLNPDKHTQPIMISGLGKLELNAKGEVKGLGRKWLYFQWLNGDPSDCYKPSALFGKKFGEKSALKLLGPCQTDAECWGVVLDQFMAWSGMESSGDLYTYTAWNGSEQKKTLFEIMQMYLDCARMLRWEGDKVDVLETLQKLGVL